MAEQRSIPELERLLAATDRQRNELMRVVKNVRQETDSIRGEMEAMRAVATFIEGHEIGTKPANDLQLILAGMLVVNERVRKLLGAQWGETDV